MYKSHRHGGNKQSYFLVLSLNALLAAILLSIIIRSRMELPVLLNARILPFPACAISITGFLTFAVCVSEFTEQQTPINLVRINADVKHSYYHLHSIKDGLLQCYYSSTIYPDCEEDEITAGRRQSRPTEVHFS